jgi:ABC-type nitrate/sulfonate/bicarbonate transport system substrate-binding protein
MRNLLRFLTIIAMLALFACAKSGPAQKVTFCLDWTPNTNHTGVYVAVAKGFFQREGLDVKIIQPSEGTAHQIVASGSADFGVSYQEEVTRGRAAGIPVKSLAAVLQHNTSAFASPVSANIKSPADFAGKRYGSWGSPMEEEVIKALMEKAGADPKSVKIVNGITEFFGTIGRDADFEWIFQGWDGIEAERRGMKLNLIYLKDLDPALDYYTPVIIASDKTLQEKPELARKFMKALAEGYTFATEHPDEAADILIKAVPELNAELVKASQKWISAQYIADATRWGEQKPEVWQRYADFMRSRNQLTGNADVSSMFTNEYLPQK